MLNLCRLHLALIVFCFLPAVILPSLSFDILLPKRYGERRPDGAVHVPLLRGRSSKLRRRGGQIGTIGLGDDQDV
jgi:hypothetical protein